MTRFEALTCEAARILTIPVTKSKILRSIHDAARSEATFEVLREVFAGLLVKTLHVKIPFEKLYEIPLPAFGRSNLGQFFLITGVKGSQVELSFGEGAKTCMSKEEFSNLWNFELLLLQTTAVSGQHNFKQVRLKEAIDRNSIFLLSVFLTGLISWASFRNVRYEELQYYVINLLGLAVSSLLLNKSAAYQLKVCHINSRINCSDVVSSKYSTLLGIPLSWLSFSFFLVNFFIVSFSETAAENKLWFLKITSLLSIPLITYSLYCQFIILKKFCVFCVFLQILTLIQVVALLPYRGLLQSHLDYYVITSVFTGISISYLIIFSLVNKKENDELLTNLKRLKFNRHVISGILENSAVKQIADSKFGLYLGPDKESVKIHLTLLISLRCRKCFRSLHEIRRLLQEFSNVINIRIMYAGDPDDISSVKCFGELILISINDLEDSILDHIDRISSSEKIDIQKSSALSYTETSDQITKSILDEARWCIENNIVQTPTFLINGIEIPNEFDIHELRNFILYLAQRTEE